MKLIYTSIKICLVVLLVSFTGVNYTAHAQATPSTSETPSKFVPLADYKNSPAINSAIDAQGLTQYLNAMFRIILSAGAFAAVCRITWAGYLYMGSADMWSKKDVAKKMFADSIIGLLILFGVYLILFQINPNLLNLDILKTLNTVKTATVGP
ncbi:MAG: hypothetical protein JWO50_401 [Candidatus Kaiserbacteria bacterium]|nr:hypothetical protein [Candidatus Kaiserbacteria bacterium]